MIDFEPSRDQRQAVELLRALTDNNHTGRVVLTTEQATDILMLAEGYIYESELQAKTEGGK